MTSSKKSDGAVRAVAKFSSGRAKWTIRYIAGSSSCPKLAVGIFRGVLSKAEFDQKGGENHFAIVNACRTGRLRMDGAESTVVVDRRCSPGDDIHFELDMDKRLLLMRRKSSGDWIVVCDSVPAGEWSPVVFTFGKKEIVELSNVASIEASMEADDSNLPAISADVPLSRGLSSVAAQVGGGIAARPGSVARLAEVAGTAAAAFVVHPDVSRRSRIRAALAAPVLVDTDAFVLAAGESEANYMAAVSAKEAELLSVLIKSTDSAYNPKIFESQHNYLPNMNTNDRVSFEKTRSILVGFDD